MSPRLLFVLLAAALLAALLLVYHQSAQKDTRAMELAVEDGLKRFYDATATNQTRGTNGATFRPELLARSLHEEFAQRRFLPTFVLPQDTFVSSTPVPLGTSNLLCVTQPWKSARYGLDATGRCRMVTDAEFEAWPHAALAAR
jgi:hypothetical protein